MDAINSPIAEQQTDTTADLQAITQLYEVGSLCVRPGNDVQRCLNNIIETAITLTKAEKGNLQLLDRRTGALKIAAQYGFDATFIDFLNSGQANDASSCEAALKSCGRIIVEDVTQSALFAKQPSQRIMLDAGARAVQSTPLVDGAGTLIGMISTYFNQPHRPGERELRLMDLLARQAADYLERKQIEGALQRSRIWLLAQREALEAALKGAPLEISLGILVGITSRQFGDDVRGAFYLADAEGSGLHHIVGMPTDYAEAVDGFKIGPESLACGLAMHMGRPIVTADVNEEPLWNPWLWLAEKYGYRGCWSFPINTSAGKFVGSFTVYWPQPCEAQTEHLEFASLMTQSAAIIIARHTEAEKRRRAETQLHESEQRLRTIIEQLPAGVGVMDKTGTWTLSNSMMERYVPKAIPSSQPDRIPYWQGWDKHGQLVSPENWPSRRALRGETVIPGMEMLHTDEDGNKLWLRVSASPLYDGDGEIMGACAVVQDITQLQEAETILRDADRRKDEFLAILAHELRNPLAPICNGLHILRLTADHDKSTRNIYEMLDRQASHMVRLVDDLLEVARITGGKVELRKELIDLAKVLHNAVEISEPLIGAAHHKLIIDIPVESLILEADPVRLAQVIANLLNNAAKYTDDKGRIWLTTYRENTNAVISVKDNGKGIPAAMLPKVFDLFTQVERPYDCGQGGLGIGLTLVRKLVEMHDGSVEAKSEGINKGSEFIVRLPIAQQQQSMPDISTAQPTAVLPRRILIVDDNRDAADSLGMILKVLGIDVCIVRDGPTALTTIKTYRPDIVLLDIGMPGMNGYEVARRVRQQPYGSDVSIIAVSGWGQEEDRRLSKEAGIDHHLIKPVNIDALKKLLASWSKKIKS